MLTVTRRFEFDFAHHLPNYDGKCANIHGHRGMLDITVDGINATASYPNMVVDFHILDKWVKENIINLLDHHDLNDILEFPTAEEIVIYVFNVMELSPFKDHVVRIRFYETPDSYAEWIKY